MEGLSQATKVLLNSSKQGYFTKKKCFFYDRGSLREKRLKLRLKIDISKFQLHSSYRLAVKVF